VDSEAQSTCRNLPPQVDFAVLVRLIIRRFRPVETPVGTWGWAILPWKRTGLVVMVIKTTTCCLFKTKRKICVFFENISCVSASECV